MAKLDEISQGQNDHNIELFFSNFELIMKHENDILLCDEYFFVSPFLNYEMVLGYLLLGWRHAVLMDTCPDCTAPVYLFSFAASQTSGNNSWTGFCLSCQSKKRGRKEKYKYVGDFESACRKTFRNKTIENSTETYEGFKFSFAGDGLEPAEKVREKQQVSTLVKPVSLNILLEELNSGNVRPQTSGEETVLSATLEFDNHDEHIVIRLQH
ncbi:MAG: hypothetical protein K2X81_05875 [Candidatus Obscuribacterales bacterium]|nr:hypothetical protein [Candidatus Obscuribacterales bacterium]